MFGGGDSRFARLETESQNQTKTLDRIEAAQIRQGDATSKRFDDFTVTVKGWIDHAEGNRKSGHQELERRIALKADILDLEDNQKKSDERFEDVKKWIAAKADKSVADDVREIKGDIKKAVWIVMGAVISGVLVLVINPMERVKEFNHRPDTPAAIHAPVASIGPTR